MRVEALTLALRPRPMSEAADLGAALVRTHAASIWRSLLPVYAVTLVIALASVEIASWLPTLMIFWLKPWLDRTLLFVLSRAVFGQATRWADVWQARATILRGQLLETLTLRRLSPWRSFTLPVALLEGQRGKARRLRRSQLLRARRGSAGCMHAVFANVEMALYLGAMSVAVWFAPEGTRSDVFAWLTESQSSGPALVMALVYGAVVLAVEPFYVAAGFAMYLNRRVELEAWDIEQEFRGAFGH